MGEKYIITNNSLSLGYELVYQDMNAYLYKNTNAYPIGYATNKLINSKEFNSLNYPDKAVSLLEYIVVGDYNYNNYVSKIEKIDLNYNLHNIQNTKIEKFNNVYQIDADNNVKIDIIINDDLKNKLLFIRFKNNFN